MLRPDLCDYSDAYIVAKGTIPVKGANDGDMYARNLVLKNNAPFISCILKTNNTLIGNAEDLDIVMPMYNLIEYSKTPESLWNYYRAILSDPITNSESFKYKTSITGKIGNNENTKEVEFSVPLKHLSNFWRTLDMTLINCVVFLTLICSKNCVLTDMTTRAAEGNNPAITAPTGATFKIINTNCIVQ